MVARHTVLLGRRNLYSLYQVFLYINKIQNKQFDFIGKGENFNIRYISLSDLFTSSLYGIHGTANY